MATTNGWDVEQQLKRRGVAVQRHRGRHGDELQVNCPLCNDRRGRLYYNPTCVSCYCLERVVVPILKVDFIAELAGMLSERLAGYVRFFPGLQLTSHVNRGTMEVQGSIADGGESYQEMSSGERTCAQMVMGLALRDLTSLRYPGAVSNVLLFDEVMGTIDLGRVEQTVNFYTSLLTGPVDTILCISHWAELKEYFPLVWSVRKGEFSELVA